jgi:hypothetical protein
MRGLLLVVATLCLLLQSTPEARAWRVGAEDRVRVLQDVKLRGPRGEELYLGYKLTIQYFGLGISMNDGGYILGIRGDSERYYNLPPTKEVERLQRAGMLPNPLPKYGFEWTDYAYGYLFWPVLALAIGVSMWLNAIKRARAQADNDWAREARG